MTSLYEQKYFEEYASLIYSGAGEIVDLGCWLGSTTIPLAKGVAKNRNCKNKTVRIHAFDYFVWEEWMEECVKGTRLQGRFEPGEIFVEEFQQRIKPWSDYIRIHQDDLRHTTWTGGAIELLLIDAMKAFDISKAILKGFFTHLVAGSFLIQQDFAHYYTSWIHLIQYRLQDYFKLEFVVPNSCSVVFQCVKEIPLELLEIPENLTDFSRKQIDQAFEYSLSLSSNKQTQANIAAAKVMLFLHLGNMAQAKVEFEKYVAAGLPRRGDLKIVGKILQGQTIDLSPQGDYVNDYPLAPLNRKLIKKFTRKMNSIYRLWAKRQT